MSLSTSPTTREIPPLAPSDPAQSALFTAPKTFDAPPPVVKVHDLSIILFGQLALPLILIGAGYVAGKQLSKFLKNRSGVGLTPLMAKIKNLSTTAIGGIGLNLGLLCYKQANFALSQRHSFSQFLIEDLLIPSLNRAYNLLSNFANTALAEGGDSPAGI